jgi:hypothetical protein
MIIMADKLYNLPLILVSSKLLLILDIRTIAAVLKNPYGRYCYENRALRT